jgi:hypothetical protein
MKDNEKLNSTKQLYFFAWKCLSEEAREHITDEKYICFSKSDQSILDFIIGTTTENSFRLVEQVLNEDECESSSYLVLKILFHYMGCKIADNTNSESKNTFHLGLFYYNFMCSQLTQPIQLIQSA